MNIQPYNLSGLWMFDDKSRGLRCELFVSGADRIIETLAISQGIESPGDGFNLTFSKDDFPGVQHVVEHTREDRGGNWYLFRNLNTGEELEGWLCPALFKYFDEAPEKIHIQVSPLTEMQKAQVAERGRTGAIIY